MVNLTKSISIFSDGEIKSSSPEVPPGRLPIVPYTLGIITQDLVTPLERARDVQACKQHDNRFELTKGDTYIVSDRWYLYMRKLMTQKAWEWWGVTPCYLMINRSSKWYEEGKGEPAFENIGLPCNFIALDDFTSTHARIVGRNSRNFDTNSLDPTKDNWFYFPWQFSKATMHDSNGNVWLVGEGLHVYTPVMRDQPEQWIQLNRVELFPKLPMDVTYQGKKHTITGYCLRGASVYGHAEEMDVPLRLARVPGELIHPCPEWILKEKPVPPEVRPEWQ